jgi:hypothetical protein
MRKPTALLLLALLAGGCRHQNPGVGNGDGDGGAGSGDGGVTIPDGMVCSTQSAKVSALGVDIVFLLDTSYSMDFNLKWSSVAQALVSFLGDPRFDGVGVGLQYFPLRATCDVSDYANLAVPVMTLPGGSSALVTSIQSKRMFGGTPTVVAMEGVLSYATQRAVANPDRKQVIVLATDGVPDDSCPVQGDMGLPNTIDSVVQLVTNAYQSTPSVATFVIGVGSYLTALDAIAAAGGGSPTAFLVDTTTDIQSAFASALDQIRRKALDCEFVIPPADPGLTIDYSRVNVSFSDASMSSSTFVFVGDASGCAQAPDHGWYYDNAQNPTKVILCEQTCDAVRADSTGEVDVVFGCAQLVP